MTEKAAHGFDILYRGPIAPLLTGERRLGDDGLTIMLKFERDGDAFWVLVTNISAGTVWTVPCVVDGETLSSRLPFGDALTFPISELADAKECIIGRRRTVQ